MKCCNPDCKSPAYPPDNLLAVISLPAIFLPAIFLPAIFLPAIFLPIRIRQSLEEFP